MMPPSMPPSSPSAADLRALRARLLEKLAAVKAYFEATSINLNLRSPYWGAFDALRRNQPLAESFVSDLQQLIAFIDNDLVPALSSPPGAAGSASPPAPATSAWRSSDPVPSAAGSSSINDEQTRLLTDLALEPRRELPGARPASRGLAAPIIDLDARPEPRRRSDEARAAFLPEFDVETSPIERLPEPAAVRAAPAVNERGKASAAAEKNRKAPPTAPATPPAPAAAPVAPSAVPPSPAEPVLSARAAALMAVVAPETPPRSEGTTAPAGSRPSQLHKIISLPAVPQASSIVTSVAASSPPARPSTQHKIISPDSQPAPPASAAQSPPASAGGTAHAPAPAYRPSQAIKPISAAEPTPAVSAHAVSPAPSKPEVRPSKPAGTDGASRHPIENKPTQSAASTPANPSAALAAPSPASRTATASGKPESSVDAAGKATAAKPVGTATAAASKPAAEKTSAAKPSHDPAANKPAAEKIVAAKPSAEKASPLKPAAEKPAAEKPAAKATAAPAPTPVQTSPAAAAKPIATSAAAPAGKAMASAKPAADKGPAKVAVSAKPASIAAAKPMGPAKAKKALQFDESDVAQPQTNESPSQFFRLLDARLDDEE